MYPSVERSALFQRLEGRPELHAKALDLRARVETYLSAVGATFAHYTSHAIDHSDQIIRELSAMLFSDSSDPETISVDLSMTETYFLVIAAYLHDVGMVVTDREKFEVLASPNWEKYVAHNQIVGDLDDLKKDLSFQEKILDSQELFVLALQQRFQLADYFRSRHADRSQGAISGALRVVDDYLDGDPSAGRSIAAICAGHGLGRNELSSEINYPTRRDHFGEQVNVRLLTILLRLGDLLDMRSARACPLMHSIASPLPPSSEVHWTQYERIVSRVTSPSRIEVRAECQTAEEHRLLLDWCTWIADEVGDVPRLLAGAARHAGWIPPKASVGDSHETIQIERAPGARYRAEDWRFQFDENEIVLRLVRDVHRGRLGFLRELLQNALDTTRARAFLSAAVPMPYANLLPIELREKYPIFVNLAIREGGVEAISVEDNGLGMTADIVQNYFLQIGRSWYRSAEFGREFTFNPTSRFGIGFLSVFAVSDDVSVTTRWHKDAPENALAIRLPGPKSHLLFEDSSRASAGTTVQVHLREPLDALEVMQFLTQTCVANEFDIVVTTLESGVEEEIARLPLPSVESDTPFAELGDASLRLKRVQSKTAGVFGSVDFLVAAYTGEPEDWSMTDSQFEKMVAASNPLADAQLLPPDWTAFNGLSSAAYLPGHVERSIRSQFDFRDADSAGEAGLDREQVIRRFALREGELESVLDDHLATNSRPFPYSARVAERFRTLVPEWSLNVASIRTLDGRLISLKTALENRVYLSVDSYVHAGPAAAVAERLRAELSDFARDKAVDALVIPGRNLEYLSATSFYKIVGRADSVVHEMGNDHLVIELTGMPRQSRLPEVLLAKAADSQSDLVRFPTATVSCLLVRDHPLIAAVLEIPQEHKAAKTRLLEALRKSVFEDGLASELRRVGQALRNDTLLAYSEKLGGDRYGQSVLRLPRQL